MRIMTFNLRVAAAQDGANAWEHRRKFAVPFLHKEAPDIVGFQEVLPEVLDDLRKQLPAYAFAGCGRESDLRGEHCPVAFRTEQYAKLSEETFWLSPTPLVPGSRFPHSGYWMRICTAVTLLERSSGRRLRVCNTHLDHESPQARADGADVIFRYLLARQRENALPVLLTGDFNDTPDSALYRRLRDVAPFGLRDVSDRVAYTYHEYGTCHDKIDYIYATPQFSVLSNSVGDECHDGVYLSDHYPLTAELVWFPEK